MSWTDDRVTLLKKLWSDGKTAAEIAKELGGVTRNAVIGKAHRLKLASRLSPIQQNKKAAPKPANINTDVKAVTPIKVQPIVKPRPAALKSVPPVSSGDLIDLADLTHNMCRWPSGDPQEKDFGFCGCSVLGGLPYCKEHALLAYQASTRNKILKDDYAGEDHATLAHAHVKTRADKVPTKKKAAS